MIHTLQWGGQWCFSHIPKLETFLSVMAFCLPKTWGNVKGCVEVTVSWNCRSGVEISLTSLSDLQLQIMKCQAVPLGNTGWAGCHHTAPHVGGEGWQAVGQGLGVWKCTVCPPWNQTRLHLHFHHLLTWVSSDQTPASPPHRHLARICSLLIWTNHLHPTHVTGAGWQDRFQVSSGTPTAFWHLGDIFKYLKN